MADGQRASDLERGDRVNISAGIDAALGADDERFFFDSIDPDDDDITDALVEGVETSAGVTTVYTDQGAFSVPADFFVRIVGFSGDY
ncbi:hypothetical protein [Mycolicibacterium conceptionense]|nr:hypothetical protein [Mycolicibacterium conceptionense]